MKHFNIKAAVIAAITAFSALGTTAFAENSGNSETHEVQSSVNSKGSNETKSNSNTKSSDNAKNSSDSSEVSTQDDEESSEPRISENPQLKAELQNDELYEYLMEYLNDPENFKADGSGVLIGESVFDPPTSNTSSTSNSNTTVLPKISADGDKVMYTVATRDGSIFYIVIDKSGNTENVYFLNTVDLVDLASAIKQNKTESDVYTEQEADIIAKAGEEAAANNNDNNDESNSGNNSKPSQNSAKSNSSKEKKSDTTLYVVIGVVAVVVIGIAAYKKIGPGKKNKVPAFDEDDEPEEDDEEYSEDIEERSEEPDDINEEK